jgi:hypothetical protein
VRAATSARAECGIRVTPCPCGTTGNTWQPRPAGSPLGLSERVKAVKGRTGSGGHTFWLVWDLVTASLMAAALVTLYSYAVNLPAVLPEVARWNVYGRYPGVEGVRARNGDYKVSCL